MGLLDGGSGQEGLWWGSSASERCLGQHSPVADAPVSLCVHFLSRCVCTSVPFAPDGVPAGSATAAGRLDWPGAQRFRGAGAGGRIPRWRRGWPPTSRGRAAAFSVLTDAARGQAPGPGVHLQRPYLREFRVGGEARMSPARFITYTYSWVPTGRASGRVCKGGTTQVKRATFS